MILGGGMAVCLLLSAHRAVIASRGDLCDSTAFLFTARRDASAVYAVVDRVSVCARVCMSDTCRY